MNKSHFSFLFITCILLSNSVTQASQQQENLLKEAMLGTLTEDRIDHLMKNGACLYKTDQFDNSAIFLSTSYMKTSATLALILKGADCDQKGCGIILRCPQTTLLHVIAKNSSLPIQKKLSFYPTLEQFETNLLAHLYFFIKNHIHPLLQDSNKTLPYNYAQGLCQDLLRIYTHMYKKHKRLGFTKKMLNLYWEKQSKTLYNTEHWFNLALQLKHWNIVKYFVRTQRTTLEKELKNVPSMPQLHIVTQKNTFNMREAWYKALQKYEQS